MKFSKKASKFAKMMTRDIIDVEAKKEEEKEEIVE